MTRTDFTKTKTYRTDVALSVASGKMLCPGRFSEMHELITDLAGWPVMTHHLANDRLCDGVASKIYAQVSWMAGAVENLPNYTRETAPAVLGAFVARCEAAHGATVELVAGKPLPELGVFDGLGRLGENR